MASLPMEPSLHHSFIKAPLNTSEAMSMADTLPDLNFGFDNIRERMAQFTARFDNYIDKGRKKVLDDRNAYRAHMAQLQQEQDRNRAEIEACKLRKLAYEQKKAKEAQEMAEMQATVDQLKAQEEERRKTLHKLEAELEEKTKEYAVKKEAAEKQEEFLKSQGQQDVEELRIWEERSGMRIEGAGSEDKLKFIFKNIDEKDFNREFWFELCVNKKDYEVLACQPKLDNEEVEPLLNKLNETRELGPFLRDMRNKFKQII